MKQQERRGWKETETVNIYLDLAFDEVGIWIGTLPLDGLETYHDPLEKTEIMKLEGHNRVTLTW